MQLELGGRGLEACLACLYVAWVACKYQQKQNLNSSPGPSSANTEQDEFCVGKSRAWETTESARALKYKHTLSADRAIIDLCHFESS